MGKEKCQAKKIFGLGMAALAGAIAGGALVKKLWLEKYRKQKAELGAVFQEREILYKMLQVKQNHARFSEYFEAHNLSTVAVLGMGREGRFLIDELAKEGKVTPAYGVEADYFGAVHETLTVYRLGEDKLPPVDCLVVCDLNHTEDKAAAAKREFSGKIVTLVEILDWLMEKHGIRAWRGQSTSSRPVKS
jgi:hypothetical protein|nr:hypothetical protein [Acutalibacter muris]